MAKHSHEDLFESTTMTFGEHLEELRVCLVRSLIALVIGCAAGFFLAEQVVLLIERPLVRALQEHYSKVAKIRLERLYHGEVADEMSEFASRYGLIFEEVLLEINELNRLVGRFRDEMAAAESNETAAGHPPENAVQAVEQMLPPPTRNFVKTRIWRAAETKLTTLSPHESFMIWLKAAFITGLLLAAPYIFYEVWTFVAAGLYPHERSYVYVFLPFSLALFLAGAAMAFLFVFGPVLDFLFSFSRRMNIDPDLRVSEVVSFVLFLPLGFGVAFQLPLVMLFANRIGIVNVEAYLEKWRIAILVIFVIAMVLTPADPISMMLMAGPLTALYFLGVALCKWMPRGRNPFDEGYEP